MSRYILDIGVRPSRYDINKRKSNEKKSENIGQYRRYIDYFKIYHTYIGHDIDYKYNTWNKMQIFIIWPI